MLKSLIGLVVIVLVSNSLATAQAAPGHCATWWLQQQTGMPQPRQSRTLPCDSTPVGPPLNPQVGDQWNWYLWRLNGPPAADLLPCTVRGSSTHAYVVVENSQWNVNMNQNDVDAILDYFENHSIGPFPDQGIWGLDTTAFGMPPDSLDQDGKVYLLYYDFDVTSDGFFWIYDQYCDGTQSYHSNECDVIYLNCSDNPPAGDYMVAVAAHEFQHLIHFAYDENESSWVNEGCSELAMWLFGHPDVISGFNAHPDQSLPDFQGNWADYIKSYLWLLYFYEQFGGMTATYDLVHDPAHSIQGFTDFWNTHGFSTTFPEVFANWTVANFLDDPSLAQGQFGYVGETLPAFSPASQYTSYPVPAQSATVNHWATDYIQFSQGARLHLSFDGADDNQFAVWALERSAAPPARVTRVALGAGQDGTVDLPDIGGLYSDAILVVAGVAASGGTSYEYAASEAPATTPTPAPTNEPSVSPTVTPTGTPTWCHDVPAIKLALNHSIYNAGDQFVLQALFCNPFPDVAHVWTYIVLDVYGAYWFWPSWAAYPPNVDSEPMDLEASSYVQQDILNFSWPAGTGSAQGICFLAALVSQDTGELYGNAVDRVCFDYE